MKQCVCIEYTCQVSVHICGVCVYSVYMFVRCAHDVCVCAHTHESVCFEEGNVDHPAGNLPTKH